MSQELCRAIAADGEGATRLVTVRVQGAPDETAAAHVARTIATSPLTKTAEHGRDPNWGRILAAAGPAAADAWTCDFSADYVRINADYRS